MLNLYALTDPRDNRVRFVGVTEFPVDDRIWTTAQLYPSHRTAEALKDWLNDVYDQGYWPNVIFLQQAKVEQSEAVRAKWVRQFEEMGHPVLNICVLGRKRGREAPFSRNVQARLRAARLMGMAA